MLETDFTDALHEAFDIARASRDDRTGIVGYGVVHLFEGSEREGSKMLVPFGNLITDAGDLYIAAKIITQPV